MARLVALLLTLAASAVAMQMPEGRVAANSSYVREGVRPAIGVVPYRGRFPHTVGIVADGTTTCSGALLSSRWVLTAAVCCYGYTYWDVWIGVQDMDTLEDERVTITSNICTIHPGFDASTVNNWPKYNMAIVDLDCYVTGASNYIRPAILPTFADAGNYYANQVGYFTGWGAAGGGFSRQLLYSEMTSIGNCGAISFFICATTATGEVIGNGDYGGPLVLQSDSGYTLIGIAGFSVPTSSWTVFTLVSPYLTWIEVVTSIIVS
ncbi:chymotrypsin-like [Schistocerca gregaria]|uniref:chymotrypsin-like n=1 Tax=Schistocerca gregaria TaxID=7010 RepID=UPI00211EB879|nr:chymotrypsin-like [Schistocerca gregaria]